METRTEFKNEDWTNPRWLYGYPPVRQLVGYITSNGITSLVFQTEVMAIKKLDADGVFPALLQQGAETLIPKLMNIFRSSLVVGYISKCWRFVNVKFVPKSERAGRPICLTSFGLKTLERLVTVKSIAICFDSKSAIQAEEAIKLRTGLVLNCKKLLAAYIRKEQGQPYMGALALRNRGKLKNQRADSPGIGD